MLTATHLVGFGGRTAAPTPTGYTTTASEYDGTNDYATRGANLTGLGDSNQVLVSFWVNRAAAGANHTILQFATQLGIVNLRNTNTIQFALYDSTGITLNTVPTETVTNDGNWHHVLFSGDTSVASSFRLYLDDVATSVNGVSSTRSNPLNWSVTTNVGAGGYTTGASKLNGCLSELYFTTEYLDISVEANRRKFISATGKPVSLGADGSTPTGTAPLIYAPNGDPSTNAGTGGNFTITGALAACATSPSD